MYINSMHEYKLKHEQLDSESLATRAVYKPEAEDNPWSWKGFNTSTSTPKDYLNGSIHNMTMKYVNLDTVALEKDIYPQEYQECSFDYIECRVQKYLFLAVAPILILLSLVGNGLTLSVMMRPRLRKTATGVLIAALAISDTIANITGLTRHLVFKSVLIDVRHNSPVSCVTQRFILYLFLDTSSWLLVAVTMERFLAVCHPYQYRNARNPITAIRIICAILLLQSGFNLHVFWTRGQEVLNVEHENSSNSLVSYVINCGYTSESAYKYWSFYQGWISMTMYCIIPFTLIIFLNSMIIKRLRKTSDHQKAVRGNSDMSATGLGRHSNSMTRMLLSVSIYFTLVTTPVFIFTMIEGMVLYNKLADRVDPGHYAKMELVDAITTLLLYLNHSINFFLYCLTGRRFRKELGLMFRFCKKSTVESIRKLSVKKKENGNAAGPDQNRDEKRDALVSTETPNYSAL